MIEVRGVTHRYDDRTVLAGVDVTLDERRIGVVGANGSGKSTFARLLNGLLLPSEGAVRVDALDTRKEGAAVRRKVGFVFQNPDNQIVLPTVAEDVAFGLRNLGRSKAETAERVAAVLDRYGLGALRDRSTHRLSGGEKQLLALSGVLVMEPDYIVFDEPTTLLDLRNARAVAAAIDALPQTAVVVSHDLDLLAGFERVLVFDEGRIVVDDRPEAALAWYRAAMA